MNRNFWIFVILCLFSGFAFGQNGKRVALVVGVDQYENLPSEAQLKVAVSDASLMAKTLSSLRPAFDVTLLTDVAQDAAEEALDTFVDKSEGADCALIYFAGHGIEFHGENYLLVKDTDISKISADVPRMKRRLGNEALSLQAWVDSLDATGAQVKVVILDACRDNPLEAESASGTRSVVGGKGGLAQVTPPSGSLISYSADAGQQANDGLFTRILTGKMMVPKMPMLEMFAATREDVLSISTTLAAEEKGVRHEPAEYTKLNRAGTRFTFMEEGLVNPEELVNNMKKFKEMTQKTPVPEPGLPAFGTGKLSSLSALMLGRKAGEHRRIQEVDLVWCPPTGPGGFLMGSPLTEKNRGPDETQHKVILTHGFWIGKTEVTQADWISMMETNPSQFNGESFPVDSVSYADVEAFLKKMNSSRLLPLGWSWQLPTEAQWEYACRAGTTTPFSLHDKETLTITQANISAFAVAGDSKPLSLGSAVKAVGTFAGNPWGILDMHGNSWELCRDFNDGKDYTPGEATNPTGPTAGTYRAIRGGSYYNAFTEARSANRDRADPAKGIAHIGFRIAMVYNPTGLGDLIRKTLPEQGQKTP